VGRSKARRQRDRDLKSSANKVVREIKEIEHGRSNKYASRAGGTVEQPVGAVARSAGSATGS
jgi:hypothetical protein